MLNEFKRPMWTDGPAKQPWLNYYNSYERMHSCFGDADTDTSGYGEETGMTAAQAAEVAAAMDAAKAAELSSEAQQAAGDAVAAEQQGIGINEVDSGLGGANVSMQEIDALEDLDLIGYNERDALGYFDKLDAQSRANDQRIADEIVENQSALGRAVDVTLDKEGNFVYEGADAFTAALEEIGKGASYLSQNIGIGSAISALARELGITEKEVEEQVTPEKIEKVAEKTAENLNIAGPAIDPTGIGAAYAAQPPEDPVAVQRDYADAILGVRETRGGPSIDLTNALLDVGYREEAQKANKAATEQQEAQETGGIADPYEVAYQARQDMSYGQDDPGASFTDLQYGLGADFMPGPGQPGYGGAALGGSGMTDAELQEAFAQEAFDLGIGPSSPGYAGAALGGMTDAELQAGYAQEARDMSSAGQPDVLGLTTEVDSAEKIFKEIIKKPEEKAEVVTKTPMEKYFAGRGTPAIPSSFQEYRSYLPPIGPAANADYRRTLALGTPRYQEPSGPNRSIATLAAAYGMTYDEAAKRFAPPSVPAMGGGGLRSLMEYS